MKSNHITPDGEFVLKNNTTYDENGKKIENLYEINGKEPDGSDFPTPMDAEQDEYRFYGKFQNIRLTDAEYAALSQEVDNVDDLIEIVSMHMKATGVNYRNHYARLLKWDKEDCARHKKKAESGCPPSYDVEAFAKQGFDLPELEDDDK